MDARDDDRGLKGFGTPGWMSRPERVPRVSCTYIAQETTAISDEGRGGAGLHGSPLLGLKMGDEEEEGQLDAATVEKQLESLKWHLWHGNVYRALQLTEDLECDLDFGRRSNGAGEEAAPGRE